MTLFIVSSILYICQSVHVSVFAALLKGATQKRGNPVFIYPEIDAC